MKIKKNKVIEKDYIECPRCDINNLGKQMCPCPRGSCEAEVIGKVITTREIILNPKKNKEKISIDIETDSIAIFS